MNTLKDGTHIIPRLYRRMPLATLVLVAVVVISFAPRLFADSDISDGAHGGNEHFFFLPPLVPAPSPTGIFLGSLAPVVQICEWSGSECVLPAVAEFTTTTRGSERVRVRLEDEQYIVNWNETLYDLNPAKSYRVRVLLRFEEGVSIEKELGYANLALVVNPIKFRIEENVFPLGDLPADDRAKISPVLQNYVSQTDVVASFKAIVDLNSAETLTEQPGFVVLEDFRPTFANAVVQIDTEEGLSTLAQDPKVARIFENKKYDELADDFTTGSRIVIGQPCAELNGYTGAGTVVAVLDSGIRLTDTAFGDCTSGAGSDGCSVLVDEEMSDVDQCEDATHGTWVAERVIQTAPGTKVIMLDINSYDCIAKPFGEECGCGLWTDNFLRAAKWIDDHYATYNIVAMNVSYGSGSYSNESCPLEDSEKDWYYQLRTQGVVPFVGSGNEGRLQGVAVPACAADAISVGAVYNRFAYPDKEDEIWEQIYSNGKFEGTTRGDNLDFLAPGCDSGSCGTSLAAPIAAGVWAVMRAAMPDVSLDETLLELLRTTGVPIYDPKTGRTFQRIQLDAALGVQDCDYSILVYNNGTSDHSGFSAVGHLIAADDFSVLAGATIVSGASVDVNDGPADPRWDGTVEWWVLDDNGGEPGTVIASGTGHNVEQSNIVEGPTGVRHFTVDFDFGEDIDLSADERFWLALHMEADYSLVSVSWDFRGPTVHHRARSGGELIGGVPNFVDGEYAHPLLFDFAFRVRGKPNP